MQRFFPVIFLLISAISLVTLSRHTSFYHRVPSQQIQNIFPTVGASDEVKIVVITFYSDYDTCRKSQSNSLTRSNCLDHSQMLSSAVKTKALISKNDPVICSADYPLSYAVNKVTFSQNKAEAKVSEVFVGSTQTVTVELSISNHAWKITNIACPQT